MAKLLALRAVRERQAMTQTELARRARVSQPTLSHLELGKRDAQPSTHRKLARALKVEPSVLVDAPAVNHDLAN
jgi:transcriptional regulator with XRE-family HTH domain